MAVPIARAAMDAMMDWKRMVGGAGGMMWRGWG
jgi:hypothetical protein